jgi:lipopolysaccharide transport system permease protein
MMTDARSIARNRDLVVELVKRDLRLRYKRSVLGLAWSMLNPLLQFLVFYGVFKYILPVSHESFALFLFAGLPAWNWLQNSLQIGCTAIVDHSSLVRQPGFSAAVLPVVTVSSNLLHLLLALPIVMAAAWWHGTLSPLALLGLPLIVAVQFMLTLALVYLVAAMNVTLRDTQHLVGAMLLFGFYLSPVLYSASNVPERVRTLYWMNPFVAIIEGYHQVFVDGRFPDWMPLLIVAAASAVALFAAYSWFIRASQWFVEEIGA